MTNSFGFRLLRLLRKERNIVSSLTSLGFNASEAIDILTHPSISQAQASTGTLDNMFDASDRIEGGNVIVWWNDLENDTRQVFYFKSV